MHHSEQLFAESLALEAANALLPTAHYFYKKMPKNPFIDDECSDESGDDCSGDLLVDSCGEEEPTEEDKAFICDDSDDETNTVSKKLVKLADKKTSPTLIDEGLTFDDEEAPEVQSNQPQEEITQAQPLTPTTPVKPVLAFRPVPAAPKKRAILKTTDDNLIDEALQKGKNAPEIGGKKSKRQSNVDPKDKNAKDLKILIDDVNNNQTQYEKNRTKLVVKFAQYLQRYK